MTAVLEPNIKWQCIHEYMRWKNRTNYSTYGGLLQFVTYIADVDEPEVEYLLRKLKEDNRRLQCKR